MNYPYNRHIIYIICANEHFRPISHISDLRPLRPLVNAKLCFCVIVVASEEEVTRVLSTTTTSGG